MARPGIAKFIFALREINVEVSKHKLQGRKRYYDLHDARFWWGKGRCRVCGIAMSPYNYRDPSGVRFVHRVPLKSGGRIARENVLAVCSRCRLERSCAPPVPELRVIDYNAMGDLVVQLVWAALSKDDKRVSYFKWELDRALSEFVAQLHYIPVGLEERPFQEAIDGDSTVGQYVQDITKKLALLLEEVGSSKQYTVTRRRIVD